MEAIGVDVGGTKIAALRLGADGAILARAERPTPARDPAATLEAIAACALELRTDAVVGVGIGIAGLVASEPGVVRFSPNAAWRELAVGPFVGERTRLPWRVDNDATAAAYAEFRFGAGRGVRHLLLVTVGTGIGGGIVADGVAFRGAHGFAGEIGHIVVEPDGVPCGCGNRGCLETVASGNAIGRLGREAASADPSSALAASGPLEAIDGRLVTELAHRGDPVSIAVLAEVGRRLGEGIAGLVNALDPERVVVGGGAIAAGELLLAPARRAHEASVEGREHRPAVPIVAAELGNDAGAIGAAASMFEAS